MRVNSKNSDCPWRGMLRGMMLPHQSRDGVNIKAASIFLEQHPLSSIEAAPENNIQLPQLSFN